jgi:cytidylate kinase
MAIVTIRGKLGSGAPEIGKLVANKLHVDYIDREIIAEVDSRLNMREQDVMAKEMPPARLQERIAEALARGYSIGDGIQGAYLPFWQIPLDDSSYLQALTSFIGDLSKGPSVVIYGRGSQFILKDCSHALHVSVIAPLKIRIPRVVKAINTTEDKAKSEISRFDGSAREFIKRFFSSDMDDPNNYDLVVSTERLSFEQAASIIYDASIIKSSMAQKGIEPVSPVY